jgi:hypothetical protein
MWKYKDFEIFDDGRRRREESVDEAMKVSLRKRAPTIELARKSYKLYLSTTHAPMSRKVQQDRTWRLDTP